MSMLTQPDRRLLFKRPVDPIEERLSRLFPEPVLFEANERLTDPALFPSGPMYRFRMADDPQRAAIDRAAELAALRNRHAAEADDPGRDLEPDFDPDFDAAAFLAQRFADLPESVQANAAAGKYDSARNLQHLAEMVMADAQAAQLESQMLPDERREAAALARSGQPVQLPADPELRQAAIDALNAVRGPGGDGDAADGIDADREAAEAVGAILQAVEGGETPAEDVRRVAQAAVRDGVDQDFAASMIGREPRLLMGTVADVQRQRFYEAMRSGATLEELAQLPLSDDESEAITGVLDPTPILDEIERHSRTRAAANEPANVRIREARDRLVAAMGEEAAQPSAERGAAAEAGVRLQRGLAAVRRTAFSSLIMPIAKLQRVMTGQPWDAGIEAALLEEAAGLHERLAELPPTQYENIIAQGIFAGIESAPQFATQIAAGALPGGALMRVAAFTSTGVAPVFGQTVQQAYAETGDLDRATEEAAIAATITAATNVVPGYAIVGRSAQRAIATSVLNRGLVGAASRAVAGGGAEAVQEMTEQIGQEVLAYYYRGKEIDWRQIPVAGIAGLFLGGAGRAAIEIRFRRAIADAEARQAFERSIEGKTPFERMRLTYAFVAEQAGVTTAEAMFDRETLLSRLGEQGISEEAFAGMTTEQQVAALERAAREIANEELGRIEVSREAAAQAAQEGDQGAEVVQPVSEADVAVAGAADVPGVPSAQPAGVPEAPEGGTAAAPSAGAEGVERGTPPPAEGKQGENKGKLEGKQGEVEPTRTNLDRLKELRAQGMSLDEAKAALKQEQSPEGQMARLVSELGLSPTEARRRIERPDEPPDAFAERANARGLAEGAYAFAPGLPAVARPVRSGNGWAVAEGLDGFPEGRENGESLSWAEAVAEADRRNLEVNGLPADTDMTALVDLARATTATKGASDAQGVRSDEGEVRQKARGDDVRRQGQEQAGTQPAGQVAQPPAEAVPAGQVSPVRAAFAALGPGHAKVAAALDALVAEGTMRPASADVVMLSLQGADDAYLEALDIGSAAAIRWMPKPRRAADPKKPFEPWEMTQAEFKDQYFQHNILSEDAGEVGPEGFRSGIGPNVVAVTTGQPENIIAQRYGTKAGRDIYLVPKSAVRDTPNGPKIKEGWVPTKADRFTPSRDYQPVHEMVVERALSEGKPVPIEAIADHLALLEKAGRNRVGTMLVLNKSRVRILIQRHLAQKAPEAGAADIQDASVLLEEYFHAAEQLLLSPQERAFLEAEYAKRDAKQWAEYFRDGIAGGDKEAAAYAASNFSEWFAHLGVEHALGRRLPVTPEAQSIIARLVKALRDAIKRLADRGYMPLEIIRIMDRMLAGQPSPVSTQEATDATQTQPDEDQADSGQPARPEDQPSPAASTGRKRIVKAQLERIADIEEIAKVGGEDMLTQMHAMIRNNSDDPDFSGIEEFGITPDRAKTYTPAERMRITNAGIAINHNYKVIEDRFGSDAVDKIMDAIIGGVEGQRRAIYDSMMREPGPWGGHQILSAFILSRWSMWADVERKTGRGKPKMRQEGEKIQRRKNPSSEPREMLDPSKLAVGNSFQLFGENFYVVEDAGALFLEGDAIRVSMPLADFVGTGTLIPADIGTFEEFLDDDAAPFGRHLFDPSEEPVAAGPTFSLFMPPKASETIKAIDRSSMSNAEKADVKSRIEENATDEAVIDQIIEDSSEAPPEPIQLSPEQVLRARGIEVTKKTIPGGRTVHSVSGNTYAIKDTLKKLGGSWYAKDKTWTFWSGDPTSAIAAALSERGVGPDKSKPSAGRGGAEDLAIKAARDRELNRADERPTGDVAVGAVQLSTADLIRLGSKAGIPDSVLNSQIEDVGLIRTAFEAGKPMFLIGSAPGSGKTFVIAGAIRELRDAGAERFMWVTMNQTLIEQIRGDVSAYGLAGVEFATYADLSANKEGLDTTNTVLILDEAHNVKNETLRGATASKMIRGAKFTLFSSATPFENPVQAKYLEPTGLFDAVGGHTQWAILFGAHTREIKGPRGEKIVIPYWRPSKESAELAKGARRWFEKQGVLSQRPLTLPPDMVYAAFERYSASDEFVAMYDSVQKAYDDAERVWRDPDGNPIDPKTASLIAMHRTNATKRILEAAKTQEVIRRVRELRAAGRKVVVFVETKADREIGRFRRSKDTKGTRYAYPQITEIMAEWQMERDMARASGDTYPPRPFSEAIVTIAHSMYNHGLSDTSLPSVTDEIVQAIPDAFVFTGELSDAKGRENLAAWRETKDGVLLATMAKGGTGLSLHDKIGDFPTAMVVLNMPWSATQLEQVSGRINRYGLASRSENYFAFAENIPFEAQLARRIGGRLRAMNATVKGLGSVAADALEDFDFESGFGAETMLLAEEQEKAQGGRETEREIDAFTQAEALDKTRRQSPDKEMDFFATPYVLSAMMAKILAPRGRVLEPSVGEGNLLKFLPAGTQVDAIEPHVTRIKTARGVAEAADIDATFHNTTFGSFEAPEGGYDGIIMNPPFSRLKGEGWQDITHVRRAFDMLSENGRLVAVMSEGPFFREDAQSTEFREWLDDLDATIIRLPEGAFSDSGTGVRARVVVIDKQGGGAGVMTLDSLNADDVRALSADVPIRPETKQFFGRDLPGQLNLAGDQVGSMTGRQGSLFAPSAAPPVVPQGTTSLSFGLTATDLQTAAAFSDGAPTPAFAYGVKQYLGGFEQAHRTRDMSDAEYREAVNGYAAARAGASPMQRQGAEFLAGQAGRGDTETGMLFGRAFHGSPYTFDRFSTEKIGTGEGAQAYGYGLYFAGKKEVAEWYRRSLTYRSDDNPFLGWRLDGKPIDPESNEAYILRSALRFAKPTSSDASKPQTRDLDEAIASLRRHADFVKKAYGEDYGSHLMYESAANTLERYKSRLTWIEPGRVYEVELAPQEDEYLLWDRPLSEQSEKVQKALLGWRATLESEEFSSLPGPVRRAMERFFESDTDGRGEAVYRRMSAQAGSDRAASQRLHSLGIRGIKYLEGSSRSQIGAGRWNVVVKDENGTRFNFWSSREAADKYASEQRELGHDVEVHEPVGDYNYVIFSDEDVQITQMFGRALPPETPEFKAWFGDSKVVDESGAPMVVYHSSTFGDFETFAKSEQRKGIAGFGFYFTDQKGANIYADYGINFQASHNFEGVEKKVNVKPVYLQMLNPLRVSDMREAYERFASKDPGAFGVGREYAHFGTDEATAIQDAGYDGVIGTEFVKRKKDGSYTVVKKGTKGAIPHPVYVVFDPTQIKSATGNVGTFDPSNPDIRFGRELSQIDPKQLASQLESDFPGLTLEIFRKSADAYGREVWELASIVVPPKQRKTGIGSQVMQRVVDAADKAGATITLDPSKDFGATSVERLRRFYARFGFRRNRGSKADLSLSGAMFRKPAPQAFGRAVADDLAGPTRKGPPAKPNLTAAPDPPQRPRIKIDPDAYRVARRHDITTQTRAGRAVQAPLLRTQMAVGRVVERFIDHRPLPSTTLAFSPNAAITAVANILDHIGILRGVSTGGVYSGSRAVTEMAYLRQWNARAQEIRDRLDANITAAIGERAATRGILETLGWQGMRQSARRVRQYTGIPWQRLKRAERETKQLERRRAELMRIDPDNRSPRQQAELDELPFKIDQQRALAASLAEQFDRELTISLPEGMTGDEVRKGVEAAFAAFSQEAEQLAKRELAQSEAAPLIRRYLGDAADYAVVSLNADYIEGTAGLDRIMRMIYGVTEEQAAVNAPFKPGQWVMAMDRRNYGQVVQINVGEQSAQVRWINKRKGTSAQRWMPWGELMPARADESRPLAPGPGGAVEMKDSAYWRQGGVDRPPLNPDDPRDMQEIVRQINADRIAFKVDPDTPFVNEVLTDPAIRFDDLETRSYIAGQRRRAIDDFFLDTAKRELGLWDTPIDTWEALLRTIELAGEEAGLEPSKAPDPKQRDRENARQQAISAAGIQTLRNMIDFILERQQTAAQDHAVVGAIIGGVVEGVKNYTVARSLRTAWLSVGTESARLVARHVSRAGFRNTILDFTRALYGQLREMTPIGRRRYRDFWDGFLSTAGVSHTTRARELAGFDPVTRRRLQREDDMRATMTLTGWMLGGLPLALTREAASLITTGRFAGGRRRVPALRHFTLEEGSLAERRASLAMTNAHFMRMLPWLAQIDRMLIDGSAKTPGEAIRSLRPPVHIDAHDYVEVKARISSPHLARLAERQARREGIGRILGMDYFEGHAPETMAYKGYLDFVGRYINSATPTPTTKPITMQEDRGAAMLARFLLMFRSWAMADATQAGRMALTQSQGRNFAVFTAQLGASLAIKFARTMLYFGFGALAWQKWEELWDDEEIVQTLTDIIAYANLWGPSEAIMQPIITAFAGEDWRREQLARGNIHPAAGAIEDASRAALYTVPKVWKADDDLTPADVRRLRRVMILPEAFPFMLWRTDFERSDLDGSESSNRKARALLQRR